MLTPAVFFYVMIATSMGLETSDSPKFETTEGSLSGRINYINDIEKHNDFIEAKARLFAKINPKIHLKKFSSKDNLNKTMDNDLVPPCAVKENLKKDPSSCSKYYWCLAESFKSLTCPANLYFNQVTMQCEAASKVFCDVTTVLPPTTSRTTLKATPQQTTKSTPQQTTKSMQTTTRDPSTLNNSCCKTSNTTTSCNGKENPCGNYKVVCYFSSWAWYRSGMGSYSPSYIDPSLCTHVVYSFAVVDQTNYTIQTLDPKTDTNSPNEFYRKASALRSKGICVLLGLARMDDSPGPRYNELCVNETRRRKFVLDTSEFLLKFGFCGLDIAWENPSCGQGGNCQPTVDKKCFADLLCDLQREFKLRGLLVTIGVSGSATVANQTYDIPRLSSCVDHVSIMSYDYHGHWEGRTGHVAPLFYSPGDLKTNYNAHYSISYWVSKGMPRCKLIMGIPAFGQTFTLASTNNTGLNAPSVGPGEAGVYTRTQGVLAYYEICFNVKRNWTVVTDHLSQIGPYAFSGTQWVSYDDCKMVQFKTRYLKLMNLGGAMVWSLDMDDFRRICGCESNPLLKAINRGLCRITGESVTCC